MERNILDLAVRRGLSLYTTDRARGTVDTAAFAPEDENPIVDAPEKKQQKGDFIFRWVHFAPFHNPPLGVGVPAQAGCLVAVQVTPHTN